MNEISEHQTTITFQDFIGLVRHFRARMFINNISVNTETYLTAYAVENFLDHLEMYGRFLPVEMRAPLLLKDE
jgi:hypothetical protein